MPGVQNNTRWTHWAVPEGPPPPGGWPVIVTFEVSLAVSLFAHLNSNIAMPIATGDWLLAAAR